LAILASFIEKRLLKKVQEMLIYSRIGFEDTRGLGIDKMDVGVVFSSAKEDFTGELDHTACDDVVIHFLDKEKSESFLFDKLGLKLKGGQAVVIKFSDRKMCEFQRFSL